MAHLIVKDRKLCMVNGRFVTSANGAPCVCGDGGGDPGPCPGSYSTAPFVPCGVFVQVSGVNFLPEYYNSIDSATYTLTSMTGVNGLHFIPAVNGGGLICRNESHSINIPYRVEYDDPLFGTDRFGAMVSGSIEAHVAWCEATQRWYLTYFQSDASENTGDWHNGTFNNLTWARFPVFTDVAQGVAQQSTLVSGQDGTQWYGGGSVSLVAVVGNCSDVGDPTYKAVSCDGNDEIWVNLPTDRDGWNAEYNDDIYKLTGDQSTDEPPTPVVWITDECDNDPNLGDVFERCTPRDDGFPERVRVGASMDGFNFGRSRIVTPDPSPAFPNCQTVRVAGYRRIEDDGGTYPDAINMSPSAGPCSSIRDYTLRQFCGPSDAGDPQDPNNPAITDPGIQRTLPIQDLSGYDIEREINAARQGGCCGQPVK